MYCAYAVVLNNGALSEATWSDKREHDGMRECECDNDC